MAQAQLCNGGNFSAVSRYLSIAQQTNSKEHCIIDAIFPSLVVVAPITIGTELSTNATNCRSVPIIPANRNMWMLYFESIASLGRVAARTVNPHDETTSEHIDDKITGSSSDAVIVVSAKAACRTPVNPTTTLRTPGDT